MKPNLNNLLEFLSFMEYNHFLINQRIQFSLTWSKRIIKTLISVLEIQKPQLLYLVIPLQSKLWRAFRPVGHPSKIHFSCSKDNLNVAGKPPLQFSILYPLLAQIASLFTMRFKNRYTQSKFSFQLIMLILLILKAKEKDSNT